jgi:prefoldin subunit 5
MSDELTTKIEILLQANSLKLEGVEQNLKSISAELRMLNDSKSDMSKRIITLETLQKRDSDEIQRLRDRSSRSMVQFITTLVAVVMMLAGWIFSLAR